MKWNDYLDAVAAELEAADRGLTTAAPTTWPCSPYICLVIEQIHSDENAVHGQRLRDAINSVLGDGVSSFITTVLRQREPELYGPMTSLEVRLHWLNLQREAA